MPKRSNYDWYVVGVPKRRATGGFLGSVGIASIILGVAVIGNGDLLWGLGLIGVPLSLFGLWVWFSIRRR